MRAWIALILCAGCDRSEPSDIEVLAESMGIDYAYVTARAKQGDSSSLQLHFHLTQMTDGGSAWFHCQDLYEIARAAGDERIAAEVRRCTPDLKASILRALEGGHMESKEASRPLPTFLPMTVLALTPPKTP